MLNNEMKDYNITRMSSSYYNDIFHNMFVDLREIQHNMRGISKKEYITSFKSKIETRVIRFKNISSLEPYMPSHGRIILHYSTKPKYDTSLIPRYRKEKKNNERMM